MPTERSPHAAALIELIGERVSFPRLEEPAPSQSELAEMLLPSLRVPDHLHLKPWRFLSISGEQRRLFGDALAKSKLANNPSLNEDDIEKAKNKALRAPLILLGITKVQENPKVPAIEQHISTGLVLHNLGLCLYAKGYASVWRTGDVAFCKVLKAELGLATDEDIVGFLYIGTASGERKSLEAVNIDEYLQPWPK